MDLRLVEYFVAVVDHGGITRAAESLYIAQPSLSQAIRTLERSVGADLFERRGRGLVLTEAGRRFEVAARRVMDDVAAARARVEAVRRLEEGRLLIAALPDLTLERLPSLVHRFRVAHPGVQVRVSDPRRPAGVVDAVRHGTAELGLTTLPVRADALTVVPCGRQRMMLVVPPALAAELPDPVPQSMLSGVPLMREIDDSLADLVTDPDVLPTGPGIRCAHRQLLWELVMAGAGAAVLPEGISSSQLVGVVERVTEPEISREVGVVYRAGQLSPAGEAFLALLVGDPIAGSAAAGSAPSS
ncbi:LysR family transcriptional regulator [Nocardioides insulae]|uniref:LysR family transcriptional regulator n=1 Tax=Nocardioides insulae TaxID=394734 RepID=UPI00041E2258|nr:LysR family transcriptional regulator [Nocardioides insulae]